jgi:hypothetical protein
MPERPKPTASQQRPSEGRPIPASRPGNTRPPWWRHSPLAVPIIACLVFVVLIAGGLAVRKVIILLRSPSQSPPIVNDSPAGSPVQGSGPAAAATTAAAPVTGSPATEPDLAVLPPLAAKEPGRRLPRLLVVGETADMFPSIEKATEVAISGDVIEVRTNRPMVVGPVHYDAKDKEKGDDLTIRAGKGFQPVLRVGGWAMFAFANTRALIQGLHLVHNVNNSIHTGFFGIFGNGRLNLQDCSITAARKPGLVTFLAVCHADDRGISKASIVFERCTIRGQELVIIHGPPVESTIVINNCLVFTRNNVITFLHAPAPVDIGRVVRLQNNTLIAGGQIGFGPSAPLGNADVLLSLSADANVFVTFGDVLFYQGLSTPTWKSLFGTTYRWSGRDNLFSGVGGHATLQSYKGTVASENLDQNIVVKLNLLEWNSLWGGNAEVGSEIDAALFARPFVLSLPGVPIWEMPFGPDVWTAAPTDFALQPVGAVARFAARGVRVGCDVTRLPVPPAATLEPYELPAAPAAK